MDAQTLVVLLIVAAALAFVGRRAWAALRPRKDAACASDCGCGDANAGTRDWSKT
ncbi:FeoB-associated Cys-rich membrane protein [Roseisolibacter sp. H3M3-2]|uniref:FeoB-associated Cys-rich membrane protein n=1 Tax=Roseisolibacter sp. H3M3-2 TaxID=3031323 RepID=UPI0023DB60F9|nr:FeoB-associated Cys-rich membrane protein [Roseisolibacter sp. H3M3-2]MDF1503871.1 FeoB-associated Cys-rich membrane protein [Roseisolibacter sp. H3M3-2]